MKSVHGCLSWSFFLIIFCKLKNNNDILAKFKIVSLIPWTKGDGITVNDSLKLYIQSETFWIIECLFSMIFGSFQSILVILRKRCNKFSEQCPTSVYFGANLWHTLFRFLLQMSAWRQFKNKKSLFIGRKGSGTTSHFF